MTKDKSLNFITHNFLLSVFTIAAICLSIFQVWYGITAGLSAPVFRPIHVSWVLVLVFLVKPMFDKDTHPKLYLPGRFMDLAFCAATIYSSIKITNFNYDDISFLIDGLSRNDLIAGSILMILLLEATRRTVGFIMVGISAIFLVYALYGDILPSSFASKGFTLEEVIRFHIYSTNGVFGAPLAIAAGVVFMFILFGAFLNVSGAGKFFIDASFAAAGKYKGGPAKASVLASAALGSISGSAIANTVTTGAFTIPMMKKLGYKPEQAAGIEAAASTGGQIMPPVMGAGAFVMAQFTGIPYSNILLVSIAPAILYFACTLLYVHLMATKLGLSGMDTTEKITVVLKRGWHFLLPLILLTSLLLLNYSPVLVGIAGCAAIVCAALIRKETRFGLKVFFQALKEGANMTLSISCACATAGIVVGVVGQTGIGLQFTQFLLALSGGYLWSVLALIMIAAIILGMGLPVTAAYIVLSIMAVPALTDLGLSILTAHMIVFWLSQTSNVTPPIALAAFAGAGVANASPMKSAVQAFKLAQGFFLIPLMMAFSNLVLVEGESMVEFVFAIISTIAIIIAFAGSIEGLIINKLNKIERVILAICGVSAVFTTESMRAVAVVLIISTVMLNYFKGRKINAVEA